MAGLDPAIQQAEGLFRRAGTQRLDGRLSGRP
jgi:hypothetical protein